jgi:hypothetical protein
MKPTAEEMEVVDSRVCTYKCGSCEYLETNQWRAHEAHYQEHQESK